MLYKKCLVSGILLAVAVFFVVRGQESGLPPVTDVCLGCICEASSKCNLTLQCDGEVCGLFRITWAYWADAGKPTLAGVPQDSPTAYSSCVVEPRCAGRTVQGYMAKYGQDCNDDGVINCYDHMAIHKKGGYGCRGELPADYSSRFHQCIAAVQSRQG